jgi:voltage-gated potassium channel
MILRSRIFEIIQPDDGTSKLSKFFDRLITALILASVVMVFVGTFDTQPNTRRILSFLESIASIVFTVEYVLRIATADFLYPKSGVFVSRVKYITSPMAVVDLVAILPFWLPMFLPGTMLGIRALRLVRLLRIFKLNRYFDAMKAVGEVIVAKKRELLGSLFFVALLMLISSLLMYSAEHDAQPEVFRNAFSGLWWAVATLTTVGYGDIYPVTGLGRFIGAFIAFSGLAAVAIPTGIITSGLSERISKMAVPNYEDGRNEDKRDELMRTVRKQGEELERIADMLRKLADKEDS